MTLLDQTQVEFKNAFIAGGSPALNVKPRTAPFITEGRMRIGPVEARVILSDYDYAGQRESYGHHVTLLADFMTKGQWMAGGQICFGNLGGALQMVNGRHRMHAIIASGTTQEFQVLIVPVGSTDELAALYYRFDVALRARSHAEILGAAGISEKYGLLNSTTKSAFMAALWIDSGFRPSNYQADPVRVRNMDGRMDLAAEWWASARLFQDATKGGGPTTGGHTVKRRLGVPAVFSVGLVTMKHCRKPAIDFWGGISANDGLRKGDPRRTLLAHLIDRKGAHLPAELSIVTTHAWNAWHRGEQINFLRVTAAASDLRIAGTPYSIRRSALSDG